MIPHLHYQGITIYVNDISCTYPVFRQVRFPKSKRKRIRKKWEKNKSRNWKMVIKHRVIAADGKVYMSQKMFDEYKEKIKQ